MKTRMLIFSLIPVLLIIFLSGCQEIPQSQVIAEVAGNPMTTDDLVNYYQTTQLIDSMIWDTVQILEANERGLQLDEEKYRQGIDTFIQQRGGKEATEIWLKQMGASWRDILYFQKMQMLTQLLLESEVGEPSEADIDTLWNEKQDRYRQAVANKLGKTPEELKDITKDDARDDIIQDWKSTRMGEVQPKFQEKLKAKYNIVKFPGCEKPEVEEKKKEANEVAGLTEMGPDEAEPEQPAPGPGAPPQGPQPPPPPKAPPGNPGGGH